MKILATLGADLHACPTPPPARQGEPDWHEAMARPLREIDGLCQDYDCPFLLAGDVCDRWALPHETVNFLIKNLPRNTVAVPGNHDLPYHSLDEINRCAYHTLVLAGTVHNLGPGDLVYTNGLGLIGFPCGVPIEPADRHGDGLYVAVVHDYLWKDKRTNRAQADAAKSTIARDAALYGYDVIVVGDNHIPFEARTGYGGTIFNCGSLMRRHSDQIDHKPSVGLLYEDGTIKRHYLDISKDVFEPVADEAAIIKAQAAVAVTAGMAEFVAALGGLGEGGSDFRATVRRWAATQPMSPEGRALLLASIEAKES